MEIIDAHAHIYPTKIAEKATAAIGDILSHGKVPILCGGTGLYINAVLYDLSFSGDYDPALRESLMQEKTRYGKEYMHAKLAKLDPDATARLHVNDEKRVLRAIEKALTGGCAESDLTHPKYPYLLYVTDLPRDVLYTRIERRVDRMIDNGLKEEVDRLLSEGIGFDRQCMQAIAYKEWAYEKKGEMTEDEVIALIKKNTRNYAKRQITWFKQYQAARRIDVLNASIDEIAENICREYHEVV